MPNPWDVGSARLLESFGFPALATTSAGFALTLGKLDGGVARAENHLRGVDDLDDTIARLSAYREAGADAVYAPGLVDLGQIERVVREVGLPVNVLALPRAPRIPELAAVGVRRVSTGSLLSN